MLYPIVNAEAYAKGEITDFSGVGVKSIDDSTLEVTLNAPTPYFLQLMDHYSTFAVHPETLLKYGKMTDRFTAWTRVGNLVGNGAFALEEWSINRRIIVKKNEFYWDRDRVSLEGVYFYPTENAVSEERMFRAEQLHYTQVVPLDKIPEYRKKENSPYVQAPYLGTYYYLINTRVEPVNDVRVRKALAYAVDRETLTRTVLQDTAIPAYSITPPNTLGYNPPKLFDYDPEKGDLNVSRFVPDTLDDSFTQTSLTLEGRVGKLDALYTGAYLDREAEQQVDYSGYANVGAWLPYLSLIHI